MVVVSVQRRLFYFTFNGWRNDLIIIESKLGRLVGGGWIIQLCLEVSAVVAT